MKIEHGSVTHDDCLMAYLFAHYIWTYGTNLNSFFIYKKKVFGDLKSKASKYESMDRESAENEYINRFNSVAMHNKKTSYNSTLSSQGIIEEYLQQQEIERRDIEEQEIMSGKSNGTLSMLNSFYNNDYNR